MSVTLTQSENSDSELYYRGMEERTISGSMLLTARSTCGEMPSTVAPGRGTLTTKNLRWALEPLVPMFTLLVLMEIVLDELTMSW